MRVLILLCLIAAAACAAVDNELPDVGKEKISLKSKLSAAKPTLSSDKPAVEEVNISILKSCERGTSF